MHVVIVFDVSDAHRADLISRMINIGYYKNWFKVTNVNIRETYNLPHNMLWKPDVEFSQAKKDIQNVILAMKTLGVIIELERCIVLSSTPWEGIMGSPIVTP